MASVLVADLMVWCVGAWEGLGVMGNEGGKDKEE